MRHCHYRISANFKTPPNEREVAKTGHRCLRNSQCGEPVQMISYLKGERLYIGLWTNKAVAGKMNILGSTEPTGANEYRLLNRRVTFKPGITFLSPAVLGIFSDSLVSNGLAAPS